MSKKDVKLTKREHAFKDYASTYNVDILNLFNSDLQLKDIETAITSVLIELLTQLKRFQFVTTLQSTLKNSNTQFLKLFDSSNKFFGPLNITHFFRQKNSRYLEYLGRSNKIFGPLDDFLSFSRTFILTFRPKFESSKVRTFYSIFW